MRAFSRTSKSSGLRTRDDYDREFGDTKLDREPKSQRISDANKMELQESGWLKGHEPEVARRRQFMKWLEQNHKQGEAHEHLRPGSSHAEEMLRRWRAEEG